MSFTPPPYISARLRALHDIRKREGFIRLVRGLPHSIYWLKYLSNVKELEAFGDAAPVFATDVPVDALLNSAPTIQNATDWGSDERTLRILYMLRSDVDSLGITTRDRMRVDGVVYQIFEIDKQEDQGHEQFAVVLRLTQATDIAGSGFVVGAGQFGVDTTVR